jgi:hypothetical protein
MVLQCRNMWVSNSVMNCILVCALGGRVINCESLLGMRNIKFANARQTEDYELLSLCYVDVSISVII